MKTYLISDKIELSVNQKQITDEGYLVTDGIIARTGIQEYYAFEFGSDMGVKPTDVIKLYRPPEEVFAPDSIFSFENAPVTIDHPANDVTADNWAQLAKGEATNVRRTGNDKMAAKLTIKDKEAVKVIMDGKKQLSNGYRFTLDMTPGVSPQGEAYDGVQRHIRGNHVAIVDRARCGSVCSILDNQPEPILKGGHMAEVTLRKMVVDGIPIEVSDAAAAVIDKLQKAIEVRDSQLSNGAQELVALTNTHKAALEAKDKELVEVKKLVMTPEARDAMVADWADLVANAKKLVPAIETKSKDCEAIRREVLTTIVATDDVRSTVAKSIVKDVSQASNDLLKIAFDAILPLVDKPEPTQGQRTNDGAVFSGQHAQSEVIVGRDRFLKASQDAWKPKQEGAR
jgi:uncharacterized protein